MRDSVATMLACIVHIGDRTGVDEGAGEGWKTLTRSIIVRPPAEAAVGSTRIALLPALLQVWVCKPGGRVRLWCVGRPPSTRPAERPSLVPARLLSPPKRGEWLAEELLELLDEHASSFGNPSRVNVSAGQGQGDVALR